VLKFENFEMAPMIVSWQAKSCLIQKLDTFYDSMLQIYCYK